MNPKSVSLKLLFGYNDDSSNEWYDGITAKLFRDCINSSSSDDDENLESIIKHLHWILFDGPVDALWIENMNTVLDDNKKLCLANGETIRLSDQMSILFEVQDLLEASPATVSRCGMVYLEEGVFEWKSAIQPWV